MRCGLQHRGKCHGIEVLQNDHKKLVGEQCHERHAGAVCAGWLIGGPQSPGSYAYATQISPVGDFYSGK